MRAPNIYTTLQYFAINLIFDIELTYTISGSNQKLLFVTDHLIRKLAYSGKS